MQEVADKNPADDETRARQDTLKADIEDDPEEWIRNHVIGKNMLLKAQFFTRMGMGSKVLNSMSKEGLNRMSSSYINERARVKQEEQQEEKVKQEELDEDLEVERTYTHVEGDILMNFMQKTDDQIRQGYINKLINMKILKLEPAKKHQTMIIFDWDDTLLCTHFLAGLGFVDLPPEILQTLSPLDNSASKVLAKATEYGETFIITNAAEGWVQASGKFFLPKTYKVITEKNIEVISARSGYEDMFPGDSHRWKVEAFLDIERKFDKNIVTNLICLGDSHIEMDAAHVLAQKFRQAMIKTIKFREHPKPDEMVKQHELVYEKLDQIYTSIRNLTIRLERKSSKDNKGL